MGFLSVPMYRAMCFDRPVGPWRLSKKLVRDDLMDQELGGIDEWGKFYIIVPGEMQIRYVSREIAA